MTLTLPVPGTQNTYLQNQEFQQSPQGIQPDPTSKSQPGSTNTQQPQAEKATNPMALIAIAIVVIIAIIAALMLSGALKGQSGSANSAASAKSSSKSQSNGHPYSTLLVNKNNISLGALVTLSTKGFNRSEYEVSYSGAVSGLVSGEQVNIPLTVAFDMYKEGGSNITRLEYHANLLGEGNNSEIFIQNGTSYYKCTDFVGSTNYTCTLSNATSSPGYIFNISKSTATELNSMMIQLSDVNATEYNGMACTEVASSFPVTMLSQLEPSLNYAESSLLGAFSSGGYVSLSECISNQYTVPLTVHIAMNYNGSRSGSLAVDLHEVSYSTNSSPGIVATPASIISNSLYPWAAYNVTLSTPMTYQGWTIVADYINETNSIANSATFTVSYNGSHNILPSNQSTIARGTVSEFDYKGHNLEIEFIKTYPNQKQIEIALVTSTNPT